MNSLYSAVYEYKVGGSLPPNAPTYVSRQADEDLFNHLQAGTFCYVLNSRQMGKSSLRVKTMNRLQEAGIVCATVDLTEIIELEMTRNQFYKSITRYLAKSFNLLGKISNFNAWWQEYEGTPMQGLANFIKEVLLTHEALSGKNLIIFVDEVDSVLRLPFPVNDFFALIRACHNNRAEMVEYNRLTFAILGVASPYDLIKDSNHSPPFNFGQAIELKGFELQEAEPIAVGLKSKFKNYKQVLKALLSWTGGQPFLTQKLCKQIVEEAGSPPKGREEEWVEKLVRSRIIENWESQDEPEHLRTIRDRLLRNGQQSQKLLQLYQQILQGGELEGVIADETPEKMQLRLSGLVVKQYGKLKVSNRIYECVFDKVWTEKALGSLPKISLLPPEDRDFLKTLSELERSLLVAQLAQVHEGKCSAQILYEVLRDITLQIGNLLNADRTTIYLLNEEKSELWSVVAENESDEFLDIQVRLGEGIAGQVALTKQSINIPDNVYQDPRSNFVKEFDLKYNYHTANILAIPLLNEAGELIAVVQLLNKLKLPVQSGDDFLENIDSNGFTAFDEQQLVTFIPSISRILESCQSCYKATRKLRATAALAEATRSLDKVNLDTKEILQRVMNAAKKLLNADRSTLWLVDREQGDLWTEIPGKGELRCELGVGFAGKVAQTRQPMIIPFDLYAHPDAGNAKETDKKTGYRTCSLLCMPVLNPDGELLGITQLLNKRKIGDFPEYNPTNWPQVPEQFKASFDENDRQSMQVFNERVGVILQYAQTHEALIKIAEVQPKEVVHNTLAMLCNVLDNGSEEVLYEALYNMLSFLGKSLGKLLNAERATIFIFNSEQNEFWSLTAVGKGRKLTQQSIPADERGVLSEILLSHLNSIALKGVKALPDRRIFLGNDGNNSFHNLLVLPIVNQQGNIVAIVELANKIALGADPIATPPKSLDTLGFTQADEDLLKRRAESMLPILEGCQSFYREIKALQGKREIDELWSAISSVTESSCHPQEMLKKVLEAAKKLTNSDRSTLWLVDRESGDLRAEIPGEGELRCEIGVGFAGKVAQTRQSMMIPFDLYKHPDASNAKKTDKKTGYRTFSLLCTPVLSSDGKLLGVTQLVNKRKPGSFPPYKPGDKRRIPDYFKASFNERDRRYMEIFNNQVGIILQSTQQKDIIRHEIQTRLASTERHPFY